ncbi:TerB N-terminal domain-containing protein [Amaricoccus solimangrovi]|uniref:TerB N-terminal domain-containing protein n=1 Tax=Amaricoccus solimangrovi TaxID=2589815 RepID=A0A501WTK8_9RHOB|nr:TerB N-terminal domain-containing protein [Amaricoccus solimangrovi]TPE51444.1 hypothetical protein FJM51_09400 [Amaricoccus solimangrovi]
MFARSIASALREGLAGAHDFLTRGAGAGKESAPAAPAPGFAGWIPAERPALVAGLPVGGMIYLGAPGAETAAGGAWIDPALPAETEEGGEVPPGAAVYAELPPGARGAYLRWLASGRADPAEGCVFLYFQGLERRFFLDSETAPAEREAILDEAIRLRGLDIAAPALRDALERFIDAARVILCRADLAAPPAGARPWGLPLALRVPVGAMIMQGMTLTHEWLFGWWSCAGRGALRPPALRHPAEFGTLFALRFARRFPEGYRVRLRWAELAPVYRAATGAFERPLDLSTYGEPLPDIGALSEPLAIADELVEAATAALDRFDAFLEANPGARDSAMAHAFLPADLRPFHPSPEAETFLAWTRARMAAGGHALLGDILFRLGGAPAGRPDPARFSEAAEALERLGVALTPDPRAAVRPPGPSTLVRLTPPGEPAEALPAPFSTGVTTAEPVPRNAATPWAGPPREVGSREAGPREAGSRDVGRRPGAAGPDWQELLGRVEASRKARAGG